MRWPIGIAVVLFLVIAIQIGFAVVAVQHADTVDPTYAAEAR
ncbi:MAG: hypothetical protein Q8P41_01940 [Pseudomonadota bacterium]|nr:hypothetical protein [Pseudomonadota bacterium]